MQFIVWHVGGRKRGSLREDKLLGDVEAESEEQAGRFAAERWPGLRLELYARRGDNRPSAPPRGA
jgi:hypothetical protein